MIIEHNGKKVEITDSDNCFDCEYHDFDEWGEDQCSLFYSSFDWFHDPTGLTPYKCEHCLEAIKTQKGTVE